MGADVLWLFLFLALTIGWFLGYYTRPKDEVESKNPVATRDMKHRLQLLFDSYTDESIDSFIHSLEVSQETLSIHISIGKHFRDQGEVEKAILIHQNLMAHPELSDRDSEAIIYELAQDYKTAGLFDRAESLLEQLKNSRQYGFKSLKLLLNIYEHEKDWNNAVSKGQEIDLRKHPDIALRVAQYCCEIAEEESRSKLYREAESCFKRALVIHKTCIRALLGLANMSIRQENYADAIHYLKKIAEASPENIVIILAPLLKCTQATKSYSQHQIYLQNLLEGTEQVPIMLAIVDSMIQEGSPIKASRFLTDKLLKAPSLDALDLLLNRDEIEWDLNIDMLKVISDIIRRVSLERNQYRCGQCGFKSVQLHWMCPSCKNWQTIKPVVEYEKIS